jgi:hypothetical protein
VIEYVCASLIDFIRVSTRLREQDRREVELITGRTARMAVIGSWRDSKRSWAARVDGRTVAIFGVAEHIHGVGIPWLLGTDDMVLHQRALLVDAQSVVDDMQAAYPTLYNWTHSENTVAIRWLKRLGFKFAAPVRHNNATFLPFYRHRHV